MQALTNDRRMAERRAESGPAAVRRETERRQSARRQGLRRRTDAVTVEQSAALDPGTVIRTVPLGAERGRRIVAFACGCVAIDPAEETARLNVLVCTTHAALQVQLRRRRTDRYA